MYTNNDIVRLAVDVHKGTPAGNYSIGESTEALRKSLVEINNGKDYLDVRDIRDGKCNGLFAVIEEIIAKTVIDDLQGNEFFFNFVESRNLALGDKNEFFYPDDSLLYVSEVSSGNQGIRRQRLSGGTKTSIPMKRYGIKVYEELDRLLAGRADINVLIDKATKSFTKQQYDDIFAAWTSIVSPTATGSTYIPAAGSYDEETLLNLCEHVEVNNGSAPVILGTRSALRKLKSTTFEISDRAKDDIYNMGYFGKWNGYDLVRLNQVHKRNTDDFILPDNQVYIVGANSKPVKHVTEGQALIIQSGIYDNADLTQDWLCCMNSGVGIITSDKKIGVYTMSN